MKLELMKSRLGFKAAAGILFAGFFIGSLSEAAGSKSEQPIPLSVASRYFAEAQTICQADHGELWGISLCGPMMFVDNLTRFVVANQDDANGILKPQEGVFTGILPVDQNAANTATEWSGVLWTQMLWPLPDQTSVRETLMAHELFHRIQKELNLPAPKEGNNQHLDTVEGRYYMQLEWRALARAIKAPGEEERLRALTDALAFRAERYKIFPEASTQEAALEMNEGLAEYTGVRLGNREGPEQVSAALKDLEQAPQASTFVRSFAYATGPAYGLLLDRYVPQWRRKIRTGSGFVPLLQSYLHITFGADLDENAARRALPYDAQSLKAAEVERDRQRQEVLAKYRKQFVEGPVLTLALRHMQVQFDPRNLQPLGDLGTVYPSVRVTDEWGVLEASQGALMKPDWSAIILVAPLSPGAAEIKGAGWTLHLNPGWKLAPAARAGDFMVKSGS